MGLLRLFLALSVIAGHSQTTVYGFNGIGAWYAVNFFYIISGFYMAMVLNEKYKDTTPTVFYKSRIYRLFPVYYIGLLMAVIVSFDAIALFFQKLTFSSKVYFIFQNIFIFGQDLAYVVCARTEFGGCASPLKLTINPPAWSLSVELGFYLIAPFIVKSPNRTFAFIIFGCIYLLGLNYLQFPIKDVDFIRPSDIAAFNYYFYPSSFIFFGGGALAYHLSKKNLNDHYFVAIVVVTLLSFTQTVMPFWHLLFLSVAIPQIFNYTAKNKLDRLIGELSYPAYILHFPILLFLRPWVQSRPQYFEFISLGSWVATISCLIGLILFVVIEKRINAFRRSKDFLEDVPIKHGKIVRPVMTAAIFLFLSVPIAGIAYIYIHQNRDALPFFNWGGEIRNESALTPGVDSEGYRRTLGGSEDHKEN